MDKHRDPQVRTMYPYLLSETWTFFCVESEAAVVFLLPIQIPTLLRIHGEN